MGAAATQVVGQFLADLAVAGVRVAIQQRLGGHHHAVDAVAALGGLFVDEGLLQRMGMGGIAESFEGNHLAAHGSLHRGDAGAGGDAIHQHGAGAALAEAAAELGTVQLQVVAQDIEQGVSGATSRRRD